MKRKMLFIFIICILIFTGCKKEIVETNTGEEPIPIEEEEVAEEVKEEEIIGKTSPLSGLFAPDEKVDRRVVAIMFDNHPSARWQAGLKDAEIIYEIPVEYPYTRYMGLFLINDPESIGPIRSARPYFITKVMEFDGIYVRVGGSEQAKSDIRKYDIADIDGLTSSNKVFWRMKNKKAPHNLYSSMNVIRQTQVERNYREIGTYEGYQFNESDINLNGYSVNSIQLNYRKDNITEYIFDEENNMYKRYKDGQLHIDESDKSVITAKNIIIQEVNISVIDKEGRLRIDLIGEGKGKYITNGNGIDITWVKKGNSDKTYYYDGNGNEIKLNTGITWIQIIQKDPNIVIE